MVPSFPPIKPEPRIPIRMFASLTCPLHGPHLHFVHPAAVQCELRELGLECGQIRRRRLDIECSEVLAQVADVTRARWRIFVGPDHSDNTRSISLSFNGADTTCSGSGRRS